MPIFVFNNHIYPTGDAISCPESAFYILQFFANNFATKRESVLQ